MKIVILCGGKGTRLGELTGNLIPKPMADIGGEPILLHIMRYYRRFGHREFVLCTGHLSWAIKSYFLNFQERHADFTIDLAAGETRFHDSGAGDDWLITIAETGPDTMTAGRIRRVMKHLPEGGSFMLTYGDGLADVDLDELLRFHESHGKGLTMTGVIPPGRFGEIGLQDDVIRQWAEKPMASDRYINGGFMVIRRDFAERFIASCLDDVMLEREPFELAAKAGEMMLYRHSGFWQCMDTMRDWELLNQLWSKGAAPWASKQTETGIDP
jgi:glucose-1-phosphate cytidylyltransferase